jgi:hypothetical protein
VPRRTHPLLLAAALAVGLLLALGVAACGSGGSQSAETLDTPPLTVGTSAIAPSASITSTMTTTTTSTTAASSSTDTGGAADAGGGTGGTTGATGGDTSAGTGADTGAATGGGTAPATGGGGGTTTQAQPSNPGGAAPNYKSFCDENPGAC